MSSIQERTRPDVLGSCVFASSSGINGRGVGGLDFSSIEHTSLIDLRNFQISSQGPTWFVRPVLVDGVRPGEFVGLVISTIDGTGRPGIFGAGVAVSELPRNPSDGSLNAMLSTIMQFFDAVRRRVVTPDLRIDQNGLSSLDTAGFPRTTRSATVGKAPGQASVDYIALRREEAQSLLGLALWCAPFVRSSPTSTVFIGEGIGDPGTPVTSTQDLLSRVVNSAIELRDRFSSGETRFEAQRRQYEAERQQLNGQYQELLSAKQRSDLELSGYRSRVEVLSGQQAAYQNKEQRLAFAEARVQSLESYIHNDLTTYVAQLRAQTIAQWRKYADELKALFNAERIRADKWVQYAHALKQSIDTGANSSVEQMLPPTGPSVARPEAVAALEYPAAPFETGTIELPPMPMGPKIDGSNFNQGHNHAKKGSGHDNKTAKNNHDGVPEFVVVILWVAVIGSIIVAAVALFSLWRPVMPNPEEAVYENVESTANPAPSPSPSPSTVQPPSGMKHIDLPNGVILVVSEYSVQEQLATFLIGSDPTPSVITIEGMEYEADGMLTPASLEIAEGNAKQIAEILKAFVTTEIEIRVHTDASGSKAKNLGVSASRAKSIVDLLVRAGVDPGRVKAVGRGESDIPAGTSEEDSITNKRTELVVIKR